MKMQHLDSTKENELVNWIVTDFELEDLVDINSTADDVFCSIESEILDAVESGCIWSEDTNFSSVWNYYDETERLIELAIEILKKDAK